MRTTNTFALFAGVTGIVLAGLALTGCGASTAAAPEQTRTSTVTKTVPAPSNSTSTAQSSSTNTSTSSTTTGSGAAKPAGTLGPNGYGKIKLGMSLDEAKVAATIKYKQQNSDVCDLYELFTAGKSDGYVGITKARGVEAIGPDSRQVSTPEGVTIGSTVAKVKAAYPSWDKAGLDGLNHSRSYVTVPGNSKAVYRIMFMNGAVETLTLQYQDQSCYE